MFLLLRITECAPIVYRNIASVVASCNTNNFFFGAEIFNPQKLNVFFLDQNHRNLTPQKLPVIRYILQVIHVKHCTSQLSVTALLHTCRKDTVMKNSLLLFSAIC